MGQGINRLRPLQIERVKAPGMKPDGGGLYLRVSKTGAKSWIYKYMTNGVAREMGLGPLHDVGLEEAREWRDKCRKLRRAGIDPIDHRKAQKRQAALDNAKTVTFGECVAKYIESHRSGWKNAKHVQQWENTLATYAAPITNLPVSAIDTGLVMQCLEPIWETKPETAGRVRGRIESVLDWAAVNKYREGENPARWRGHLNKLLPERAKVQAIEHHPALSYAEVPKFIPELRSRQGAAAMALEFAILTATRTGEVIGGRWDEVDFNGPDGPTWTIPASRMKAKKEHRVPLSGRAVAILREAQRVKTGDYLFPGAKPEKGLSNMAMLTLLRRMGRQDITVHGFRSSFRDWAAERTNTPNIVCEMALAHTIKDEAEKAYRRGDLLAKRQKLMEAWAAYCESNPGQVVQISTGKESAAIG